MCEAWRNPWHPVIFSDHDWDVQTPPPHSIWVPIPFSGRDWIPRERHFIRGVFQSTEDFFCTRHCHAT